MKILLVGTGITNLTLGEASLETSTRLSLSIEKITSAEIASITSTKTLSTFMPMEPTSSILITQKSGGSFLSLPSGIRISTK